MRSSVAALAVLLIVPVAAHGVDYGKIDRTIEKEPIYQSKKPLYALLLFGPEAKVRVWVVVDGKTVYLDRNADSDLTAADERFAKSDTLRQISIRDPDAKTTYVIGYKNTMDIKDPDGKPTTRLMTSVTIRGPVEYLQYGDVQMSPSASAAKVCHYGGPLSARPKENLWKLPPDLKLQTGDKPTDLAMCIGTFDAEHGCWVVVQTHVKKWCNFPDGVRPTVEVEYPSKEVGGPTVRKKYAIDGFC